MNYLNIRRTIALTAVITLLSIGIATADTVVNTAENPIMVDDAAEQVNVVAGAAGTVVTLKLTASNNDGSSADDVANDIQGCALGGSGSNNSNNGTYYTNPGTSPSLKLIASGTDGTKVSVTQPAAFTECVGSFTDTTKPGGITSVTVTGLAEGSSTITFTIDEANSNYKVGSKFRLTTARFTVNVSPAPATGVAPTVGYSIDPDPVDGNDGWYRSDVTLTWNVTGTPTPTLTGCENLSITTDQVAADYSCSATNSAGDAGPVVVTIKRDATPPAVEVTGVGHGATYTLGQVPTAGCSTDDEMAGVATQATLQSDGGPVGSVTVTCSGAVDNAGNTASDVLATFAVHYDWTGFLQPVDNTKVNVAKAGSAIPVKFKLGGDQGLDIFGTYDVEEDGTTTTYSYPRSASKVCDSSQTDAIEQTVTAGASTLQYDAFTDTYTYVWKTTKAWAGSCRQLQIQLKDGSQMKVAEFRFTK